MGLQSTTYAVLSIGSSCSKPLAAFYLTGAMAQPAPFCRLQITWCPSHAEFRPAWALGFHILQAEENLRAKAWEGGVRMLVHR